MTISLAQEYDPKRVANVLIGERIHTLMWRGGRTQRELAAILNVDQGSVSKRLRGNTNWSAVEVSAVAAWLGVDVAEILPEMEVCDPPDPSNGGAGGGDPNDGAPSRARTYDLRISSAEAA
jgi:transcriptional regulator with XRE-family HTH domain